MPRKRYPVTAAEIDQAVRSLPDDERVKWLRHVREMIVNHAVLTEEERDALLRNASLHAIEGGYVNFQTGVDPWREWALLYHRLESRNRKPSPEIIRRNVEICDLRKKDMKLWSLRNLAKKYHVTWQVIQRIVKEEIKWRSLAASLWIRVTPY